MRFLQTPATVWGAQSVLIDEISRCKPEHQNRLFSLVHERRIQGIALPRLRWRWAAMNPCPSDSTERCRSTWDRSRSTRRWRIASPCSRTQPIGADLDEEERRAVADPAGEGQVTRDDGAPPPGALDAWRAFFEQRLKGVPGRWPPCTPSAVTAALNTANVRISPAGPCLMARSPYPGRHHGHRAFQMKERLFPHRGQL